MGNTDSQYSNFIIPGKGKSSSSKLHTSKEEALSPHSWWRSTESTSGYKAKNGFSPHKNSQPYISRHYDCIKGGSSDKVHSERHRDNDNLLFQGNGFFVGYRQQTGGLQAPMKSTSSEIKDSKSSPKVIFREDGSLRVEFTNARREPDVALSLGSCPSVPVDATQRASNGSSLSSEGSWYDSPWGNGTEDLCDNVFTTGQPSDNSSGYTTLSSTRTVDFGCFNGYNTEQSENHMGNLTCQATVHGSQYASSDCNSNGYNANRAEEDSGIGDSVFLHLEHNGLSDLYTNPNMTVPFPTVGILAVDQLEDTPHLQTSPTASLDVNSQDESQKTQNYTSQSLPCRKAVPDGNARKDSLKSRIRRLSDWTGSLRRKKRRLQEPSTLDFTEVISCGAGGTLEESRPFWNPMSSQTQLDCSGSSTGPFGLQNQGVALRQNIYDNFMQGLETGSSSGTAAGLQVWDGEGESSSGSMGSLEQMDFLFQKEQGVVRRAGWLAFKTLITLHKDRKLELVARRKWRQYWVTLKGSTLLLGESNGKTSPEQECTPHYAVLAEDSIVQAVPEHPKKEHVFCLSNAYGDVYLFQAANQTDLENWVTAIHSASASHLAKRQGKEDTLRLLKSQSRALLQKIDMDGKMKKMAELQLSVISDQKNRKAIESQILQWEQNLEKFNIELFRMRCYLASLQGTELPNPKSLLATAGRPSKMVLGRLGIFSVSSFHALICTRDEATLKRRSRSHPRGMRNKRGLLFSSQKGLDSLTKRNHEKRQSLSQIFEGYSSGSFGHPSTQSSSDHNATSENHIFCEPLWEKKKLDAFTKMHVTAPPEGNPWDCSLESRVYVLMPDSQVVSVPVKQDSLVADVLSLACKAKQLDPALHCLHTRRHLGQDVERSTSVPTDQLRTLVYDELEVWPLNVLTINMSRPDTTVDFGFAVTGHVDGARRSHVYVSEVNPEGLAFIRGLKAGDEILTLNGVSVASLDLGLMQNFFSQQELRLILRREDNSADDQSSVWPDCDPSEPDHPQPPQGDIIHLEQWTTDPAQEQEFPEGSATPALEELNDKAERGGKNSETVCNFYQTFPEGSVLVPEGHRNPYSTENAHARSSPRHMSVTERLHMVIQELVDTEKSYVKDLGSLFEIYLKPLQRETFLSHDEMESLFGSLPEMLDFQRVFLQTLEERTTSSPDYHALETPEKLKKLLFSLGGSFLYYADHFKLYSGFCANHIKVQKVLKRAKTDWAFKEFLEARNPTKQHSSTLESYLIKPVQRVLKYPLLLRELVSLTDPESDEHSHLTEALKAMEKVASHINEMQKIYEDYGTVFDQLVAEQSGPEKEVTEISMGEFIIHSSALWQNPLPSLGRMRKDPELTLFLFKSALILVYRESKLKKRMTSSRPGDLDPFKFRWLIPVSSLQVRPGNSAGSENPCVWEVVHTKSEVEGRPEMSFQLCSSNLENKANAVRAIRTLLRENAKRTAPAERRFKDLNSNFTFPRRSHPGALRTNSWQRLPPQSDGPQTLDSDEGRLLDGYAHSEPPLRPSRGQSSTQSKRSTLCSLTSALEAQLQRLNFVEEPQGMSESSTSSLQGSQVTLLDDTPGLDLNTLLARDYSVQSFGSVVNEDCFYDTVMGIQKAAIPTL
ncbi:T-lymphoma invasion and metastasis-inducing protein 2-like [Sinocyclocheilus rhinocerous]|uniref:T-lymphoma invasion and metastasis-inducing protein 2-like n=1 Tax=Sinocyclocheilus rhinocerous TaxID=307959 RepID=UPI0007B8F71D|nr:PREDICTED: T-lymphoma invasion and metastasis-inducing protein 2-like [Sinocyclocheilus rhinocerous]